MTEIPKASIVVPAYNVASFLFSCVESLLAQTEKSIEIILVDDGSTDGTPRLVDQFAADDSRVRPIHRPNGGSSVARNTGLAAARGEFVCFIDGDDWVDPQMIETMIAKCESTGASVVMAGIHWDIHDEHDQFVRSVLLSHSSYVIQRGKPIDESMCDQTPFVALLGYVHNKIYRRSWLRDTGVEFEEGLTLIEDIEFNSRALSLAEKIAIIPEAFLHYVNRPRLTLSTTFGTDLLDMRLRAIGCVDFLLETWGLADVKRVEQSANASGMALWGVLRHVAMSGGDHKAHLGKLLSRPSATRLMTMVRARPLVSLRGLWAATTLMQHWYGLALLPVYAALRARRLADRRSRE